MRIKLFLQISSFILPLFAAVSCNSQPKASYDIATYNMPAGWKKETFNAGISFIKINNANGNYAKIILYKSIAGSGDVDTDFNTEWRELIVMQYKPNSEPETEKDNLTNGWKIKTGTAPFTFNNSQSIAILTAMSSNNTKMSLVILTNTDTYQKEIERFANSLQLKKAPVTHNNNNSADIVPATNTPFNNSGFSFTTSNFDDGWTSTIQNDWVLVTKGKTKVYLFFALEYNADNFSGTGVMDRDYYWDNYVTRYFSIQSKQYRDEGEFVSSLKPKFVEGWGTEKQTGERCFIAMTLSVSPNTAYLILASSPDENEIRQQFPKANDKYASDLTAMNRYNKFAVTAKDITGRWQNGNTSTAQWYYTSPSGYEGYAGMTLAASSASFYFNTNGSYSSIHNGATGAVGNMSTFQQEYKGNYTVTNWNITATNRWQGKTDKFDASFMAVRGGRILKMNNSAGQDYTLVKVK